VLLVLAIVAVLVWIERPWSYVVVGVAAAIEIGEAWFWWWLSHRRRPAVGVETLVGARATVVSPCRPLGQVRVQGELWEARCERGADIGEAVEVVAVERLTLVVE
jgi:membrane protein implicated in regulation of membrane protease activity